MSIFNRLAGAIATAALISGTTQAAEVRPFDRAAFAAAQAQGRPILVDVKAWWCPVCASQAVTIKKAIAEPRYGPLAIFEIDYDAQKSEWRSFAVHKQGTLIAFHGAREVGRLEFITDKAKINDLLALAVR